MPELACAGVQILWVLMVASWMLCESSWVPTCFNRTYGVSLLGGCSKSGAPFPSRGQEEPCDAIDVQGDPNVEQSLANVSSPPGGFLGFKSVRT